VNTFDKFVVKKRKPRTTESVGSSAVEISVSNTSVIYVVSNVMTETVASNNSVEDCVHQTLTSY
jgi:hypothetical protein